MNFPTGEQHEIPVTDDMEKCFGARPSKALLGMDLICVFDDEETVRSMNPPEELLMKIEGRLQVPTARGKETDIVSRVFAPKVGIYEDPVTGSSHTQLGSYWSEVLGKPVVEAYQASRRGGYLQCEPLGGGRIAIRMEGIDCDYYRMLAGDMDAVNAFHGEYMSQYSWAEITT